VILDSGRFTRRGLMVDRVNPAETWSWGEGYQALKEQRVQDKKGGSGRQRDHRPVCDGKVISPYESALSWEIPLILKALVSWHQAEQGVRQVCQLRED